MTEELFNEECVRELCRRVWEWDETAEIGKIWDWLVIETGGENWQKYGVPKLQTMDDVDRVMKSLVRT